MKVGLVLSGGSARGLAHLGVLSVLEDYKIPVDMIVGASFGSILAGYLASGYSAKSLIEKFRNIIFYKTKDGRRKFLERAEEILYHDFKNFQIETLKIPVYILSMDITKGELAVFNTGPLFPAIRASSSFPGIFDPTRYKGHTYIDGGILNSMLLYLADINGADLIIFSDVSIFGIIYRKKGWKVLLNLVLKLYHRRSYKPINENQKVTLLRLISRVLFIVKKNYKECEKYRKTLPDFIIQPNVHGIGPLDFDKVYEAVENGKKAALGVIKEIVECVDSSL